MVHYIIRRFFYMIITIFVVSIVTFILIQLPPGDYLTSYISKLQETGTEVSKSQVLALKKQFGLDQPVYMQYFHWIYNIIRYGNFGYSFAWSTSVSALIWDRLILTVILGLSATAFVFVVAIPIGIYSAVRQYSVFDYLFTILGYGGLAIPNFLLALTLMFIGYKYFGVSVGGLFSPDYVQAPWSFGRIIDMINHLWIPVIVLGTAGTAGIIRVMRGMLLDELGKQYVITARAKGVKELTLLFKYPVRIALNPIISTIGWRFRTIISGAPIVAIVLSLPTTGPLMIRSLLDQDMYLAGSLILFLCIITVVGTFISDVLLIMIDPRIRMER